jgi:cystathionine gamma-lyase
MHHATTVIRAGAPEPAPGSAFRQGPVLASAYHAAGDPAASPFTYARFHNPTWSAFEAALSELEGGPALVFPSGMAATTAVLAATLRPGEIVCLPAGSYYTTRVIVSGYFTEMGVKVRLVPTGSETDRDLIRGAKLVWVETPTNPGLDVSDIAAVAAAAHAEGALVAVDNTTATPLAQQPLLLGADFVLASDSKALTGHSDLILGHVAARDPIWVEKVRTWRTQSGSIAGPFEVWMAHRALGTLAMRLERQTENAMRVATFLRNHPLVRNVRYPGLDSDPGYAVASRQMRYTGAVLCFELSDRGRAERYLAACRLVDEATSFGGLHTSAERRGRWGGDAVPEGFIRMSVGCEHIDDLLADLERALRSS